MSLRPIFVASLGNPPPAYKDTLHSAGHTVIEVLRNLLSGPTFSHETSHGKGLITRGHPFTLWQSPSLMNASGSALAPAWKAFLRDLPTPEERSSAKLVILHDDLEGQLGKIKIKTGGSAKGHNGIKDCMLRLQGVEITRIGIGIGRPLSRESADVAAYVLRKMNHEEKSLIINTCGPILDALNNMSGNNTADGWMDMSLGTRSPSPD